MYCHFFVYVSSLHFGKQDMKYAYMLSLVSVLGHRSFIKIFWDLESISDEKMTMAYVLRINLAKEPGKFRGFLEFCLILQKYEEWHEASYTWFVNQEVRKTLVMSSQISKYKLKAL